MRTGSGGLAWRCVLAMVFAILAGPAAAQSAFTYQGRLDVEGQAYTGPAWLRFTLWNAQDGGLPLTAPVVVSDVDVRDGLFTVDLDFGVEVLRRESYLQMDVRTTPGGIFFPVSPRHAMYGAPIATYARNAAGWSIQDGPLTAYQIVSTSSAMVRVAFNPGETVTQSLISPVSGSLRSVSLYLGGDGGPAELDVSVERFGQTIAIQRVTVGANEFVTQTAITFDVPADIVGGEQLRLVVQPLSGTVKVGIIVFTSDVYPSGNCSYSPGSGSVVYTDMVHTLGVSQPVSTSGIQTQIASGSLLLRSATRTSLLQISDGPFPAGTYVEFLRGTTRSVLLGKDGAANFILDVGTTRAMTITPSGAVTLPGNATVGGSLTATGATLLAGMTASGAASFGGAATFNGDVTFASAATFSDSATFNGATTLQAPVTIGSTLVPSSLGVLGSLDVNTGALTTVPPIAFRVNHANPLATGWPIRIENPAAGAFAGGMRLSSAGFFEVTNRAASGLSTGFARLDSNGNWSAVSDARLKRDVKDAPAEGLLAAALRVRPVTYFFTHEGRDEKGTAHLGVLAQELRGVLPDLVEDDGSYLTVNYAQLSVVAIGAIKAQEARLAAQGEMIEAQRREIAELRERLARIEAELRGNE